MTGTCSICRQLIVGGRAPALHAEPLVYEWHALGLELQKHFTKRHPAEATAINAITKLWVHYLLSLQVLFTDESAITLQATLLTTLKQALDQEPAASSKLRVIDVLPTEVA